MPSPRAVHQSEPSGAQKSSCRSGEPSRTGILLFNEEPEHSCLLSLTLLWTSRRLLLQYSDRNQTGARFRKADAGDHCPGLCWRQPHLLTIPRARPPLRLGPQRPSAQDASYPHLPHSNPLPRSLPTPSSNASSLPSPARSDTSHSIWSPLLGHD